MGRAERILVFAVFGVIALILGITAFLPEQAAAGAPKAGTPGAGQPGAGQPGGQPGAGQPGVAQAPGNNAPAGLTPVERLLQADREPPAGPAAAGDKKEETLAGGNALRSGDSVAPGTLGATPVRFGVQHPSNPNFLVVKVRGGETFGQIVERECGSLQHYMEQAIALNEAVEPNNIRAGQELVLPFVAEDQLPKRAPKSTTSALTDGVKNGQDHAAGTDAGAALSTFPRAEVERSPDLERGTLEKRPAVKSGGASLAANQPATSYTVKTGDTLWGLAEKRWGRGKAKSKIKEIMALNTSTLKTETDLRAGQVIKLP
jgi:nucleoid-associated protein YgaU